MEIENEFTVATPIEQLWAYLLDVERVAPCMPGAELTETIDESNWKGKVNMKLGPVSLSFAGTITMQERDDAAKRVVLVAKGMEAKGKGAANASITSWLEPDGNATTVRMKADIHLTGTVAQMSRGLLPEVSRKLTQQFADCLESSMAVGASRHRRRRRRRPRQRRGGERPDRRGPGGGEPGSGGPIEADRRDPARPVRDLGCDRRTSSAGCSARGSAKE